MTRASEVLKKISESSDPGHGNAEVHKALIAKGFKHSIGSRGSSPTNPEGEKASVYKHPKHGTITIGHKSGEYDHGRESGHVNDEHPKHGGNILVHKADMMD